MRKKRVAEWQSDRESEREIEQTETWQLDNTKELKKS